MNLTLLKQPYEISFAGNPLQFVWQVAPWGAVEKTQDITVIVTVFIEKKFGSEISDQIYVQKMYPDAEGKITLDASSIVSPYLEYYTPRPDLAKPVEAVNQRKRFNVKTILNAPGLYDLPPIYEFPFYYSVIKGGLSQQAWHYKEFFTKVILEQKQPLLFPAAKELVDPEALKFFYWIYPFDDQALQTVTYKVYFSDGTSATLDQATKLISGKWAVNCVPCGFSQSGLNAIIPLNKSAVKYSVTVGTETQTIVAEYFFTLDNRNFYEPYYLLYRNSIGGLETVRLLGQVDLAADYARQQARRTLPPSWYGAVITDESTEETFSYTADTGFMGKEELLKLRDLFLSKEKYQVTSPSGGRGLIPIVLTNNKAKFFSNKENLVSAQIDWQQAFVNTFFTPGTLMPLTRACPAIEKFFASQLNKSTLQFQWSLEDPYDQIEVQIIIGADTYIFTYKGNAGMVSQFFNNPSTGDPVNITIKARTICNAESVPADYGPFATITLSVKKNSLPVAVDDHFQIPSGWAVLNLPDSALANDYDPDGDPIEVLPEWGITAKGAVWSIDREGKITFTTQFQNWTGNDQFNYQIHEIGSTEYVTGTVFITVGNGPQQVFVKWVMRNQNIQSTYTWAEAWLDFFSDPACTIPVDITSLGLTISATEETKNNNTVIHHEDYSFLATGTKKLMWSGYTRNDPGAGVSILAKFVVLPGTGYTPVN
jgi:hypothetical protein